MTEMQMYWLTRMDYIGYFFGVVIVFSLIASVISIFNLSNAICCEFKEEYIRTSKIVSISLLAILAIAGILEVATPTTKEMAAISIVPKIVNNKRLQEIPNKLMDLATQWFDELKPKKQ